MGLKVNHIYDLYKLYMDTPVGDPSWTDLEDFPCHEPDMKERINWVLAKRQVHWNTYNPEDKPQEDEVLSLFFLRNIDSNSSNDIHRWFVLSLDVRPRVLESRSRPSDTSKQFDTVSF